MKKLADSNVFRNALLYGLSQYSGKTLETITCSISTGDTTNVLKPFEDFVYYVGNFKAKNGYQGHVNVEYCIVCVNNQHIHGIIKKPFQYPQTVQDIWNTVNKHPSNIRIYRITKETMLNVAKLNKIIVYFTNQASHHDTTVEYFKSENWGLLSNEELIKKKKIDLNQTVFDDDLKLYIQKFEKDIKKKKEKGFDYDPVVMIGAKFYYWSQLSDEDKQLFAKIQIKK